MSKAMSLDTKVFHETEGAIVRNEYSTPNGPRKFLASRSVQEDVDYYSAEDVEELLEEAEERLTDKLGDGCDISVCYHDSLVAALQVQEGRADEDDAQPVLVLNFANPFMAGGNRHIGIHAQEGEMCRRSTLFASISSFEARPFFDDNTEFGRGLYTHGMLVSPHVEVFREIAYRTMDDPVLVSFVSMSAPSVHSIKDVSDEELYDTLKTRILGMLAVAADNGYKHLVLGAWGCGSNGNDPVMVARAFHEALDTPLAGSTFTNLFDSITFAVLDHAEGQPNLTAFRNEFGA